MKMHSINNPAASSGVCCSHKVMDSGFNTFLTAASGGVLNPSPRIKRLSPLAVHRLLRGKKMRIVFFVLAFFLCFPVFSQTQPFWLTLEQGKHYFRNGAYSEALLAFEDARRTRWNEFERMESDLIIALSTPNLRRFGDTLEWVEAYCTEQHLDRAERALKELYYRYPKEKLGGSVSRALEELGRLKAYPEAEFWLGEIYRAEGETSLALRQYQKAYEDRVNLEIPGFEIEILYSIMEIHRIRQEYQEMEERAMEILRSPGSSSLWTDQNLTQAALTILQNQGIDRFLVVFRYNNAQLERAHRLLGFYYYTNGRPNAAEHLMFSILIQSTLIIEEVMRRQYDFTYTTLDSLMEVVQRRQDLQSYLEEAEYFRTLFYLGEVLYSAGKSLPARQIWTFLSGSSEAGEWRIRSRNRLQSSYVERDIEML